MAVANIADGCLDVIFIFYNENMKYIIFCLENSICEDYAVVLFW